MMANDSPPPEVEHATEDVERELGQVLSNFQEGIAEARSSFLLRLDQSVTVPLRKILEVAAEGHSTLLEAAHFRPPTEDEPSSPEAAETETPEVWAQLCSYRNGVLTEVLEPLRDSLFSLNAGNLVEAEWNAFKGDLVRLAASMPEEVSRPEPVDLYLPRDEDGFGIRAGKTAVRMRRHVGNWGWKTQELARRLFWRPVPPRPQRIQTVPIQKLASLWMDGPAANTLEPLREELHQHFSNPLAELERGVSKWARAWPVAEARFDKGMAYLPEELRELLSARFDQMEGDGPSGTPVETPAPDGEEETPVRADLPPGEIAAGLHRCLVSGRELASPTAILANPDQAFEGVWSALWTLVAASGTFMRSLPQPRPLKMARRIGERQDARAESWKRWHRAIPTRLVLAIQILRLREKITSAREHLVKGIAEVAIVPLSEAWSESSGTFHDLGKRGDAAFSSARSSRDPEAFAQELSVLQEEGFAVLEACLLRPLGPNGLEKDIHHLADEISTGLAKSLLELPDSLTIQGVQEEDAPVDPDPDQREIRPREIAQQTLDILRLEGLRHTPSPILEALAAAGAGAGELPEVLKFNLEAASEELAQLSPRAKGSKVPASEFEEAVSLAQEGLARTQEGIARLLIHLPEAWSAFTGAVEKLLTGAYQEMHARVSSEGGVQEQMIGLEARATHATRMAMGRVRSTMERWGTSIHRASQRMGIRIIRAIRLGRTVVGATGKGEGDRALAVLLKAPDLLSGLPLAYRRLFSFQPLSDDGLLKGRTEEIAWVRSRLDIWQAGLGTPNILTGPIGVGNTSFFNILSKSVFSDLKVHRVELIERTLRQEVLATRLAEEFGYSTHEPWDYPRLTQALLPTPSRKKSRVVLLERLEHLFLRTPGGTEALEDFLSFQAQTSETVFWLSSMAGAAWKLAARTEPRSASLVATEPLSPPSREDLEELILARHRRSGLPLEYRAPRDLNPLIRQRLRRSSTDTARQAILQTEVFDRLFRLSQGSIPLGILHWLRSIDFRSVEGRVWVTPPNEIRYAFLEDMDLELNFALKAFLEHGTLSLEEYREVFAASEDDSVQTFEALRARLLLESTGIRGDMIPTSGKKVEERERYRIPVLLSQVVAQRLKNRNILH